MKKKALVLLSGGLDSATCLYIAKSEGYDEIHALSVQYSQKHHIELEFAKKLIVLNQIKSHYIINLDLSMLHSSSLTGNSPVPKGGKDINNKNFIPTTYVPARNLIFLSLAVGVAEDNNIQDI